jgi:hypothetical protein
MSQMPVSPSPFDKIIRAAGAVKTKGGFAALVVVLLFLCLVFILAFTLGRDRLILSILTLVIFAGFSTFAFITLKQDKTNVTTPKPKRQLDKKD